MRLRNRIALPPLTTNYGSPEGIVTEAIIQFYTERSRDVGLVIVAASAVRKDGRIAPGSQFLSPLTNKRNDRYEECMTCMATIGRGKPMACKVNKNLSGAARSG